MAKAFSNTLCNPTPFRVKLNWDRGINIVLDPFCNVELNINQVDDFRGDKAGSEAVDVVLDYNGLFLLDPYKSYDSQALTSVKKSIKAKTEQYKSAVQRMRDRRSAQGFTPDEGALEEALNQMGYIRLRDDIEKLKKLGAKLEAKVSTEPEANSITQLDPARTVFCMDPPREFPSTTAMEFFLEENPAIKEKHDKWVAATEQELRLDGSSRFVPKEVDNENA